MDTNVTIAIAMIDQELEWLTALDASEMDSDVKDKRVSYLKRVREKLMNGEF